MVLHHPFSQCSPLKCGVHAIKKEKKGGGKGEANVTTLILNEYRQSSNLSVSGFQVQDSMMTQNAYC
jgi:hypothetical protein